MNDTSAAFGKMNILPYHGIAFGIMRQKRPQRTPCSNIAPSEITRNSVDIISLLHHSIVNRNLLACRENLFNHLGLRRSPESLGHLVHLLRKIRIESADRLCNSIDIPYEYTCIPQIISCCKILLSHLQSRFFTERIHLADRTLFNCLT